jgi:hypothetical protein
MGSPVFPAVADLKMEDFEKNVLDYAPVKPTVWYHYVDVKFNVLPSNHIGKFTTYCNTMSSHLQFETEGEVDNKLAFLDTETERLENGNLEMLVYRKPTHMDQFVNWSSIHHLEYKRSIFIPSSEELNILLQTKQIARRKTSN